MRWQFNRVCQLHWRCWDDDHIVFNASSGQTHFLNILGALTLELVAERALTLEDLLGALATRLENFVVDNEMREYVSYMLKDLDNLGLIEPAP
jgi:PqqD family protein of HPr-rel-A system